MVKVYSLLTRRPGLTAQGFGAHWQTVHGPKVRPIPSIRRYVQNHALGVDVDGLLSAPFDGIAEVWFDDLAAVRAHGVDPAYLAAAKEDEAVFIDLSRIRRVVTTHRVLTPFEDEAGRHPTKLILLAQRSAGTGPAAFHEAWPALAGTLCRRAGGAAGVAVATTLPETYTTDAPPFDAFAELWWADRRAFDADAGAFGGTADQGVHLHGLLCEEHSVIPAGGYD